ncbi:MAG TPA: tetratricopeptide repeat protein, partial [Kribbellaceae bacterium]|nr:tetratricopeptide repeat protein [Kribbellaceae bacterium]
MTLINWADLHHDAGRYDQALATATAALALARDSDDVGNQVAALGILGAAQQGLGDSSAGIVHYLEAIALSSTRVHGMHHARAHVGLAGGLLSLGQRQEACRHARQALKISRLAGYRLLEGDALAALAEIHLAGEDLDEAARLAQEALAIHRKTGYRLGATQALALLDQAAV